MQNKQQVLEYFKQAKEKRKKVWNFAEFYFRQVIKEYEDSASIKLDKVYITGGGSIFPTTKILVQDILRKEVVVVNAFSKVSYPAFMQDIIFELNPAFHVALGAALRMFE